MVDMVSLVFTEFLYLPPAWEAFSGGQQISKRFSFGGGSERVKHAPIRGPPFRVTCAPHFPGGGVISRFTLEIL